MPPLHITHVTASVSALGGGIPVALQYLSAAQAGLGCRLQVVGHQDNGNQLEDWPDACPSPLSIRHFPGLAWAKEMSREIQKQEPEILHTHGLWSQSSICVTQSSRAMRCSYIVSPHGMLDPWALANSRWKKRVAAWLFENRHLHGAACLHALCRSEADSIRAYGLKKPIAIIPNGIELVEENSETLKSEKLKVEKKTLLFLGRIHPKKGLINALRAWSSHSKSNIQNSNAHEWQFVIAGWNQGGHEAELKQLCRELGVSEASISVDQFLSETPKLRNSAPPSVLFVGPAFGEEKDRLLRQASAFILPSFSEGLPMSVLEAWSYRLPVLMTDHCNIPEGFAADAALRIGTDVTSITEGIRLLTASPVAELQSLGRNGRALVERQFTWPQVAAQMKEVYEWVLGGGGVPDCVRNVEC